jgi:nucleoside-diphosphate-sugar epimerase
MLTGAGGWIGRAVLARLAEDGMNVVCVSHRADPAEISREADAADVVVHAGGVYSNDRVDFVSGNVEQAVAVARGCSKVKNTVVFLSSVKVYGWATSEAPVGADGDGDGDGDGGDGGGDGNTRTTTLPARGLDRFSAAKRLVEDLFAAAAHRSVVLRLSNVYGSGVPAKYLIGTMLATARREGRVRLDCDGTSRRDFVRLTDVVNVIRRVVTAHRCDAAQPLPPGPHVFNLSSDKLVSLGEIAAVFADVLGTTVEIGSGPARSSPRVPNGKLIRARYGATFVDPLDGIRALLQQWRTDPWDVC